MAAYDVAEWSDFGVAVTGASAALTGLLFVAVSINLRRILAYSALPPRAGQTLILFAGPLLVGTLVLIPDQPPSVLGGQLIAAGVLIGVGLLSLNRRRTEQETLLSALLVRLLPSVIVPVCITVAGATLITGAGGGLRWGALAIVVAFVGGLANAWVLLVEIER